MTIIHSFEIHVAGLNLRKIHHSNIDSSMQNVSWRTKLDFQKKWSLGLCILVSWSLGLCILLVRSISACSSFPFHGKIRTLSYFGRSKIPGATKSGLSDSLKPPMYLAFLVKQSPWREASKENNFDQKAK